MERVKRSRAEADPQDQRGHRQLGRLSHLPSFFRGPAARPFESDEIAVGARTGARPQLYQILYLETIRSEQTNQVAMSKVKLDAVVEGGLEPVHAEVVVSQPVTDRLVLLRRQSTRSIALSRKTSSPPVRSRRLASGTHMYGSLQMLAPYSEMMT